MPNSVFVKLIIISSLLVLSLVDNSQVIIRNKNDQPPASGSNQNDTVTCTRTAASASLANVQTAVNASSAGDTVCVPAGSATWGVYQIAKEITLAGAGIGNTVISGVASFVDPPTPFTHGGARLTGFTFNLSSGANRAEFWGVPKLRIDHTRWTRVFNDEDHVLFFGGTYGSFAAAFDTNAVVDHNQFVNGVIVAIGGDDSDLGSFQWQEPLDLGTYRAIYIEDNAFSFNVDTSSHFPACIDANWGARMVFRFNTCTGGRFEQHSLQGDNQRGTRMFEAYYNNFVTPSTRTWFIRAGTGVIFHNTSDEATFDIDNARSSEDSIVPQVTSFGMCEGSSRADSNTSGGEGYRCRDQIGASTDASHWSNYASTGPTQAFFPAMFWKNTHSGTEMPATLSCETGGNTRCIRQNTKHILENRDFYNYNSGCVGGGGCTSGVGEGTSLPTSCTSGTGFWKTNEGSWNKTTSNSFGVNAAGAQGRLYVCVSGSWTLTYTPYEYPHPWPF